MDGLAQKHTGRLRVIHVDFLSPVGRAAARKYGLWLIPAVILFDDQGQETIRQLGIIDPRQITARLNPTRSPAGTVMENQTSL